MCFVAGLAGADWPSPSTDTLNIRSSRNGAEQSVMPLCGRFKTPTERETVEKALDMVAFGAEVQTGVAALAGLQLDRRT